MKPKRPILKDLKKIREKQAKNDPQKNFLGAEGKRLDLFSLLTIAYPTKEAIIS